MNVNLNCKAVIFITDNAGTKKYYASHFPSPGVCDSKSYTALPALVTDLNTLDPIGNLWPGLSGFVSGPPNIPENEKIITQVGFKGCNDVGNGSGDMIAVILKQQAQPQTQLLVLSAGTPASFMQNLGV